MNFQERDNNIYEKSNNDKISMYLKNIISRYFNIEKEINDETKEAIIIQAYTRLKQFMATYTNDFIVSLNEKSGAIDISIQDVNGEPAFEKNTAYNKNFCSDGKNEQDTITSGNDIRLSNSRKPLIHIHSISEINGLQEKIDKLDFTLDKNMHIHHNKNVLDMLRYTGANAEIDLVLIDYLTQKCKTIVDGISDMDDYMTNSAIKYINEILYTTVDCTRLVKEIKVNIDLWINWIKDAKQYTDNNKDKAYFAFINVFNDYLSQEEYDKIVDVLENAIVLFKHGAFNYPERYFAYDTLTNYSNNSIIDSSDTNHTYAFEDREGTTVLKTKINDFTINVDTTNLGSLLDSTVTVYLSNDSSRTKLPVIMPIKGSKHDRIFMTYKLSKDTITIYGYRVTELPGLVEQMIPIWAIAKDNAGHKSEYSFMIVPPETKKDYTICDPRWDAVNALINSAQPDKLTYTGSNIDGSISININASISNSVVNIDWGSSKIPQGTAYKLYKRSIQNDVIGQWEELSNANQSTQLTDTVQDTLPPLLPYISFTNCSAEPLKVKFTPTIQALDSYEVNEYRLIVVSETEANKQLFDTDVALHINCNSGIKSITYDYNFTPGIMTNRVSQNTGANIDYPRYGIQGDRCYLVSNTSKRFNDVFDANAYLSEYNCRLINESDNVRLMSQELMRANYYIDNLLSENGSCVTYRDKTLNADEYGDRLAIVFDYGKLSDIFGNPLKVEYNIYNIHSNNPLQAILDDSTKDTPETQPPQSPTGDPTGKPDEKPDEDDEEAKQHIVPDNVIPDMPKILDKDVLVDGEVNYSNIPTYLNLDDKWGYNQVKNDVILKEFYIRCINALSHNGITSSTKVPNSYIIINPKNPSQTCVPNPATIQDGSKNYLQIYAYDLGMDFDTCSYVLNLANKDFPEFMGRCVNLGRTVSNGKVVNYLCDYIDEPVRQAGMAAMNTTFDHIRKKVKEVYGIKFYDDAYKKTRYTPLKKKQIAKVIHDYIILYSHYGEPQEALTNGLNQTAYPALSEYKCVNYGCQGPICASYAAAFKYCCQRFGIYALVVNGSVINNARDGRHAWNIVTYEENNTDPSKWQEVDLTWDDPSVYTRKDSNNSVINKDVVLWSHMNVTTKELESGIIFQGKKEDSRYRYTYGDTRNTQYQGDIWEGCKTYPDGHDSSCSTNKYPYDNSYTPGAENYGGF